MLHNEENESSLEFWIEKYPYLFRCLIKIDIKFWMMTEEILIATIRENRSKLEKERALTQVKPTVHIKDLYDLLREKHVTGYVSKVTVNVHTNFLELTSVLMRLVKRIVHSYGVKDELPVRIDYLLTSIKHKLLSIFVLFENICVPHLQNHGVSTDPRKKRELSRIMEHIERENIAVLSQLETLRTITEDFRNSVYSCATWMLMLEKAEDFSVSTYIYVYAYREHFNNIVRKR